MTSRADNPTAPTASDHTHDHAQYTIRPETVIRLMDLYQVSCLNHGGHAHGAYPMHHHHDVGCLIEAGRNERLVP